MQQSSSEDKINPRMLLRYQYYDGEFIRWDTIIRFIAAEHFIKTGELHYLYKKDCDTRWFYLHKSYDGYNAELTYGYFEKIIRSFMDYGRFNECHSLTVNNNLLLFDGTHRLGVSLAMNLDYVLFEKIEIKNDRCSNANLGYYKERFTNNEVILIVNKLKELL
jgi:hypothetical protein